MEILKVVLMIIFAIDCIALTIIILMQEGKQAGLGTIGGMADTYWGQNKGRSMEGALVKSTKFLAILFMFGSSPEHAGICVKRETYKSGTLLFA